MKQLWKNVLLVFLLCVPIFLVGCEPPPNSPPTPTNSPPTPSTTNSVDETVEEQQTEATLAAQQEAAADAQECVLSDNSPC